jgi:hypothetical protein
MVILLFFFCSKRQASSDSIHEKAAPTMELSQPGWRRPLERFRLVSKGCFRPARKRSEPFIFSNLEPPAPANGRRRRHDFRGQTSSEIGSQPSETIAGGFSFNLDLADTVFMPVIPHAEVKRNSVTIKPGARLRAAMIVAIVADLLQLAVFPIFVVGAESPADDVLDLCVGGMLSFLLGWHWEFAPSFLAKLVPGIDLVPLWTLAVANVYRKSKRAVTNATHTAETAPHHS